MKFHDGTQIQLKGLEEIMAELYLEGKQVNRETAEEILQRLEKYNNYIPTSDRLEYRSVVLKEYREYIETQKGGAT